MYWPSTVSSPWRGLRWVLKALCSTPEFRISRKLRTPWYLWGEKYLMLFLIYSLTSWTTVDPLIKRSTKRLWVVSNFRVTAYQVLSRRLFGFKFHSQLQVLSDRLLAFNFQSVISRGSVHDFVVFYFLVVILDFNIWFIGFLFIGWMTSFVAGLHQRM